MNAITTTQTTGVALPATKNAFEQYGEAVSRNKIVGDLLKFSKGEYLYGQNGDEMAEGTELVANLDELMVGWIKWADNKPADTVMGRVVDGFVPPTRSSLGDNKPSEWETDVQTGQPRDPWQLTNYLVMKEAAGDKLFTFTTGSKGGMSAIGRLCQEYGKRIRSKPNELPIVALGVDSYKHSNKSFGKIFVPEFEIVGWVDKSAFVDALAADAKASAEPGPSEPDGAFLPEPAAKNGRGTKTPAAETRF